MEKKMEQEMETVVQEAVIHRVILGLYELESKLLVSPLITPTMLPYITPFKEF